MPGKRKYDELLEKDVQAVQNLLKSDGKVRKLEPNLMPENVTWSQRTPDVQTGENFRPFFGSKQNWTTVKPSEFFNNDDQAICHGDLRKVIDEFVDFYERLDTCDDTAKKPNYSYTELIFLAVMRSRNFCLPIHEIYRYIGTRFSFFRNCTREHWKNAVRHSLSKTRCFTKIGGKHHKQKSGVQNRSCYLWTIVPQSLLSFARGNYRPHVDGQSATNVLRWAFYQVDASKFWKKCADSIGALVEQQRLELEESSCITDVFERQVCLLPQLADLTGFQFPDPVLTQGNFQFPSSFTGQDQDETNTEASSFFLDDSGCSLASFLSAGNGSPYCTSESDSDISYPKSSPDSGHGSFAEMSSPDEMYRQFNIYQSCLEYASPSNDDPSSENVPGCTSYNQQSYWPLSELTLDGMAPFIPPLQFPFGIEAEHGINYSYLSLADAISPCIPNGDDCLSGSSISVDSTMPLCLIDPDICEGTSYSNL